MPGMTSIASSTTLTSTSFAPGCSWRMAAAIAFLSGGMLPGVALAQASGPTPPGLSHIHLDVLDRTSKGWTIVENTGDVTTGRTTVERVVWPLFYLHWQPLAADGGGRNKLSVEEAEKAVAGLWEGMTFDQPLKGKKIAMPSHDGVLIETTTSHGGWKSRYFVWACPDSGRLFIADTNANLQVSSPDALLSLMEEMARTVRCHEKAKVDEYPWANKQRQIEGTDISYAIPFAWSPVAGYRMQRKFATGEFSAAEHPAVTKERGQDLVLELDSLRRLFLLWEPAPDSAMTFDTLIERVHAFWKEHAINILPQGTRVSNDIWIMDGLVQSQTFGNIPPGRMHKFRAWVWRKDGVSYMAVGELSGIRFGQRIMNEVQFVADQLLEEMFQVIDY
jgi:hypothetical protein